MKLAILRPGRFKDDGARASTEAWLKLASKFATVEIRQTRDRGSDGKQPEVEARKILEKLSPEDFVVALDSRGEMPDSEAFAALLSQGTVRGRTLVFVVGGPSGLDGSVLARANRSLAFGRVTMNHDLVLAVLAEQIWRGLAILNGHPYHKGH
jgi:23S rRNA (pseudouridine1915-N3)-methyltransferase